MARSLVCALRKGSLIILIVILIAGVINNTLLSEVATWDNRDLSISPGSQLTTPEGLVTYQIHIGGTTDPIEGEYVTLSATTTHPGITYTIAPNNRAAPFTSTMTVDVSTSTPPGGYSITVVATSTWDQTHTRSETVQLTVMALMTATVIPPPPDGEGEIGNVDPPPPDGEGEIGNVDPPPPSDGMGEKEEPVLKISPFDFKVKLQPLTVETSGGEPAHYKVIIEYSDPIWSNVPINLQVESPFEWMQCVLSPSRELTITTPPNAELGAYVFIVVGTAQGLERAKEGLLTVIGEPEEPQDEAPPEENLSEEDLLFQSLQEQLSDRVKDQEVMKELRDTLDELKDHQQEAEQRQAEEQKKAEQEAAALQMMLAVISFVVGLVAGVIGSFLKGKGRGPSKKSQRQDGHCTKCGAPLKP
ncbi:hypothetical protein ACFLQ6_00075 [Thermoproteota archaeon]